MDYSLLLGIQKPPRATVVTEVTETSEARGVSTTATKAKAVAHGVAKGPLHQGPQIFISEAGDGALYYMAIIDLLQPWDWRKRGERLLKVVLYCRCRSAGGMSAVEPREYALRFVRMIDRILGMQNDEDGTRAKR